MKSGARTIITIVLLALLAACGSTSAPATPEAAAPTEAAAPAASGPQGTLRIAYGAWWDGADSLDPASVVVFSDAVNVLYERLVRLNAQGQLLPELATEWQPNEDATRWTFTLREGVTFHNGAPLTSADVAYSIKRLLDPEQEAGLAGVYKVIENIETPDSRTVVFALAQPHTELPLMFTSFRTAIIPAESGETIGTTGIGSGSFQLEKLDPTGTTRMTAYNNHWRGLPGLAALEFIGISDADARFQALQAGQVDLLFEVSPQQATALEGNQAIVLQTFPGGIWYSITMRTDTPPFDDVRVRRALRLVADRQEMLTIVNQGAGSIACDSTVWPGDPHRWNGECAQDIEQARQLLAEAGYPDGLELTLFTSDTLPPMIPLAEVYQQQAAKAGIKVSIKQVPADSYWTEICGVESFFIDSEFQYPADLSLHMFYSPESLYNSSSFDDPAFAQLLADARAASEPDKRSALYQQAQQYLFEHGGTLVPFHGYEAFAYNRRVSGLQNTRYVDLLWHEVRIAKE